MLRIIRIIGTIDNRHNRRSWPHSHQHAGMLALLANTTIALHAGASHNLFGKIQKENRTFPTVFGVLRPGMFQLDLPCRSLQQTENRNIDSVTCPQKNSPKYDAKKLYRVGEDSLFQKPSLFPLYPFLLTMAPFFPCLPWPILMASGGVINEVKPDLSTIEATFALPNRFSFVKNWGSLKIAMV